MTTKNTSDKISELFNRCGEDVEIGRRQHTKTFSWWGLKEEDLVSYDIKNHNGRDAAPFTSESSNLGFTEKQTWEESTGWLYISSDNKEWCVQNLREKGVSSAADDTYIVYFNKATGERDIWEPYKGLIMSTKVYAAGGVLSGVYQVGGREEPQQIENNTRKLINQAHRYHFPEQYTDNAL